MPPKTNTNIFVIFLSIFFLQPFLHTNQPETLEITIEQIRKEAKSLKKNLLGTATVTPKNSPVLYKLIEDLATNMHISTPKTLVAKGFFLLKKI